MGVPKEGGGGVWLALAARVVENDSGWQKKNVECGEAKWLKKKVGLGGEVRVRASQPL